MEYKFIHKDRTYSIKLDKKDDCYKVVIDSTTTYTVSDVISEPHRISFIFDGKLLNVYFAQDKDKKYLAVNGNYFIFEGEKKKELKAKGSVVQKENSVASPMPGLLVKISVATGEKVKTGTTLAIVEAMKMQNELRAPRDGIVRKINFKEGDQVDALQVIVELET